MKGDTTGAGFEEASSTITIVASCRRCPRALLPDETIDPAVWGGKALRTSCFLRVCSLPSLPPSPCQGDSWQSGGGL